ncbi:MAG: NAD-binding protein, partial [Myxococcales bacterium]
PAKQGIPRVWLFVFAIALHNLPEGLAVGVAQADGTADAAAVTFGIALQNMPEGLIVAVALLAIGIAPLKALGIAFLAGMIVGQSEYSSRAASEALPMRYAFAVLFFVSMGMLFDPRSVPDHLGTILGTLGIVLIGKPLIAFAVVWVLRGPVRTAVAVSAALAQIGEFSFIVATLALSLDLLPEAANQALVATAIVSVTLNPLLYRATPTVERWLAPLFRKEVATAAPERPAAGEHRAVVVGYGPVGRGVARILREHEIEPTIIERNPETVATLRAAGTRAVHGDASDLAVLREAGIEEAGTLIFTASGTPPHEVIRAATQLNPKLRVVARAAYLNEAPALLDAGADHVIASEAEVAVSLAEHLLVGLGATPDQIDRTRERMRGEFSPERALAKLQEEAT